MSLSRPRRTRYDLRLQLRPQTDRRLVCVRPSYGRQVSSGPTLIRPTMIVMNGPWLVAGQECCRTGSSTRSLRRSGRRPPNYRCPGPGHALRPGRVRGRHGDRGHPAPHADLGCGELGRLVGAGLLSEPAAHQALDTAADWPTSGPDAHPRVHVEREVRSGLAFGIARPPRIDTAAPAERG